MRLPCIKIQFLVCLLSRFFFLYTLQRRGNWNCGPRLIEIVKQHFALLLGYSFCLAVRHFSIKIFLQTAKRIAWATFLRCIASRLLPGRLPTRQPEMRTRNRSHCLAVASAFDMCFSACCQAACQQNRMRTHAIGKAKQAWPDLPGRRWNESHQKVGPKMLVVRLLHNKRKT